jgi:hypothetical protein
MQMGFGDGNSQCEFYTFIIRPNQEVGTVAKNTTTIPLVGIEP